MLADEGLESIKTSLDQIIEIAKRLNTENKKQKVEIINLKKWNKEMHENHKAELKRLKNNGNS